LAPENGVAAAAERQMDGLAGRYTMQNERDVHQSAAGGSASAPAPAAATAATPADGWLGDNVELF
jgi:hypothetical protein